MNIALRRRLPAEMALFLLDTCVIIDVLRKKRGRAAFLRNLLEDGHLLACCAINITEVYAGLRPGEESTTGEFLDSLQQLPVTPSAARRAGLYKRDFARKGVTLNLGDVMIAAVAADSGIALLTDNVKDFPMRDLILCPIPAIQ